MEYFNFVGFACKCFVRTALVIINNIYCIPTYVVWMVMIFPLKKYHPELYWKIEGHFFHWLLAMVSMWSWSAGYDIVEMGDDIRTCLEDRTLVIANHQSTADVPLLMATFNTKKNVLPNLMWIMDRIFKYTNFGIVSIIHQDFFIVSGKGRRGESLQELVKHLRASYIPLRRKWMVLFPEGGFLRKRRETSQQFAIKNNLPVLQHVSLPRVGALQTIVDVVGPVSASIMGNNNAADMRSAIEECFYTERRTSQVIGQYFNEATSSGFSSIVSSTSRRSTLATITIAFHPAAAEACSDELSWVLDITIAYPEGKPLDLGAIVTGYRKPCKTFLFYRLFRCTEVPRDHEAMAKWLYDRFAEKERMLDVYYKTGQFPCHEFSSSPIPPTEVSQDCLRFAILHLFFITSTYIHFQLLSYVVSYFWY